MSCLSLQDLQARGVPPIPGLEKDEYFLLAESFPLILLTGGLPYSNTVESAEPLVVRVHHEETERLCEVLCGYAAVKAAEEAGLQTIRAYVGVNRLNEAIVLHLLRKRQSAPAGSGSMSMDGSHDRPQTLKRSGDREIPTRPGPSRGR